MRAKRVGRSLVSAITQTPASGPLGPRTTPAISLAATQTGVIHNRTAVRIALDKVLAFRTRLSCIVIPMEPQPLDIAFVSDVACPWCAIGLASVDKALARLGPDVNATLRVEPFELNPDMGPEGAEVVPYLARKYGRTSEQIAQAQARIREHGAAVGFTFGPRNHVWNTF